MQIPDIDLLLKTGGGYIDNALGLICLHLLSGFMTTIETASALLTATSIVIGAAALFVREVPIQRFNYAHLGLGFSIGAAIIAFEFSLLYLVLAEFPDTLPWIDPRNVLNAAVLSLGQLPVVVFIVAIFELRLDLIS